MSSSSRAVYIRRAFLDLGRTLLTGTALKLVDSSTFKTESRRFMDGKKSTKAAGEVLFTVQGVVELSGKEAGQI